MSEEEKMPNPRWETIIEMYDELDSLVSKYVTEKDMNYLEVEVGLMMLREKINESKVNLLIKVSGQDKPEDDKFISNIYK
tara:strand:- start:751 stop:990 length:240 start_codon:yes stop_codon:yes gene_type:complete